MAHIAANTDPIGSRLSLQSCKVTLVLSDRLNSLIRLMVPRWDQPKIEPISGLNHYPVIHLADWTVYALFRVRVTFFQD